MHSAIRSYLKFIREDEGSRYVDTVSFYFCTDNRDNSGFWTRCSNSYKSDTVPDTRYLLAFGTQTTTPTYM